MAMFQSSAIMQLAYVGIKIGSFGSYFMAVSIRWTGLGTGLWDWTEGLDSQKVALIQFRSSTHTTTLQYTYIT